jgi:PadR family transcriptional regulator AphA
MSLSYAILGLLSYKEMTGYDLKTFFDSSIKSIWPAHLSQIYRELSSLEAKKWVESRIEPQAYRPDRKVYQLTELGKRELLAWLNGTPRSFESVVRDESALRMFFGAHMEKDELLFQLKLLLKEKRAAIAALDHIADSVRQRTDFREKSFWLLSLRKGCRIAEAEIAWAEECIRELEKM